MRQSSFQAPTDDCVSFLHGSKAGTLEHVAQNGTVQRTGEKAWRSGELVLTSEATRIENGAVVAKYDLAKHPEREKIVATFVAFE